MFKVKQVNNEFSNQLSKSLVLIQPKLIFNSFSSKEIKDNKENLRTLTFEIKKSEAKEFQSLVEKFVIENNFQKENAANPFFKENQNNSNLLNFKVKESYLEKRKNAIGYSYWEKGAEKPINVLASFLETEPDLDLHEFAIEGFLHFNNHSKSQRLNFSFVAIAIKPPNIDFNKPNSRADSLYSYFSKAV